MQRSRVIRICAVIAAFAALALAGAEVPALADVVWTVDPGGSTVSLSASELILAKVGGTIPVTSGTVVTAGGTQTPSRVDVVLQAAALTTHDAKRDADLRSDHFFDVTRYPQITFTSDRVSPTGPRTFTIDGKLTMRGVTRPIRFDARASSVRGDKSGKRRVHYDAVGRFRRSDYGMTYARGVVGNVVKLDVTIEAVE